MSGRRGDLMAGDARAADRERAAAAKARMPLTAVVEAMGLGFEVVADPDTGWGFLRFDCPCCASKKSAATGADGGDGWHCAQCNSAGDQVDLVRAVRGVGFREACVVLEEFGAAVRCSRTTDLFS